MGCHNSTDSSANGRTAPDSNPTRNIHQQRVSLHSLTATHTTTATTSAASFSATAGQSHIHEEGEYENQDLHLEDHDHHHTQCRNPFTAPSSQANGNSSSRQTHLSQPNMFLSPAEKLVAEEATVGIRVVKEEDPADDEKVGENACTNPELVSALFGVLSDEDVAGLEEREKKNDSVPKLLLEEKDLLPHVHGASRFRLRRLKSHEAVPASDGGMYDFDQLYTILYSLRYRSPFATEDDREAAQEEVEQQQTEIPLFFEKVHEDRSITACINTTHQLLTAPQAPSLSERKAIMLAQIEDGKAIGNGLLWPIPSSLVTYQPPHVDSAPRISEEEDVDAASSTLPNRILIEEPLLGLYDVAPVLPEHSSHNQQTAGGASTNGHQMSNASFSSLASRSFASFHSSNNSSHGGGYSSSSRNNNGDGLYTTFLNELVKVAATCAEDEEEDGDHPSSSSSSSNHTTLIDMPSSGSQPDDQNMVVTIRTTAPSRPSSPTSYDQKSSPKSDNFMIHCGSFNSSSSYEGGGGAGVPIFQQLGGEEELPTPATMTTTTTPLKENRTGSCIFDRSFTSTNGFDEEFHTNPHAFLLVPIQALQDLDEIGGARQVSKKDLCSERRAVCRQICDQLIRTTSSFGRADYDSVLTWARGLLKATKRVGLLRLYSLVLRVIIGISEIQALLKSPAEFLQQLESPHCPAHHLLDEEEELLLCHQQDSSQDGSSSRSSEREAKKDPLLEDRFLEVLRMEVLYCLMTIETITKKTKFLLQQQRDSFSTSTRAATPHTAPLVRQHAPHSSASSSSASPSATPRSPLKTFRQRVALK